MYVYVITNVIYVIIIHCVYTSTWTFSHIWGYVLQSGQMITTEPCSPSLEMMLYFREIIPETMAEPFRWVNSCNLFSPVPIHLHRMCHEITHSLLGTRSSYLGTLQAESRGRDHRTNAPGMMREACGSIWIVSILLRTFMNHELICYKLTVNLGCSLIHHT